MPHMNAELVMRLKELGIDPKDVWVSRAIRPFMGLVVEGRSDEGPCFTVVSGKPETQPFGVSDLADSLVVEALTTILAKGANSFVGDAVRVLPLGAGVSIDELRAQIWYRKEK